MSYYNSQNTHIGVSHHEQSELEKDTLTQIIVSQLVRSMVESTFLYTGCLMRGEIGSFIDYELRHNIRICSEWQVCI